VTPRAAFPALFALLALVALAPCPTPARAELPPGFEESLIGHSLDSPVSMAIAPDGRIFVCEQGGRVRVIEDGHLLAAPFIALPVAVGLEEGMLGVAFDPHFAWNHHVFLFYTSPTPVRHDVIVRVTASGDTALRSSAVTIFELDPHLQQQHLGGSMRFGRDGMLYVGTGDNDHEQWAQSLRSTFGKILRLRPDGGIPGDNPFAAVATGKFRAIWARGLRNAFSFDIDRRNGRMYVNDVGGGRFEEINEVVAGANYGWPLLEGPSQDPQFRGPVHAYDHASGGCAITGGAFYAPARPAFPREWIGRYFFADYCSNQIRWIDPANPAESHLFSTTWIPGPVDLRVGPDGALYCLVRGNSDPVGGDHTSRGLVVRISRAPAGARR